MMSRINVFQILFFIYGLGYLYENITFENMVTSQVSNYMSSARDGLVHV